LEQSLEAKDRSVRQERRFEELVSTFMRGKWIFVMAFALVVGATALFTFLSNPVYEATSMVLVEAGAKPVAAPFLDLTGSGSITRITNELETLKAQSTARTVAQILLDRNSKDTSAIHFAPAIKAEAQKRIEGAKDTLTAVALLLMKKTDFFPVKESDIIRITVRSEAAEEAALIANTYARVYVARNLSDSRAKSHALREFLQTQLEEKHAGLDSAEMALETYMQGSGIVSLDAEAAKVVNHLAQLEALRDGIGVDISSRQKSLTSLKQALAAQEPNVEKSIGQSNDAYIRLLQEQLAKLEVQRDVVIAQNPELSGEKIYSEKLKEIDSQIASLQKNLEARTKNYIRSLIPGDRTTDAQGGPASFLAQAKQKIIEQQVDLDGLVARKQGLNAALVDYEKEFNKIPEKSMGLAKLQRARVSSEKLYLLMEEKYNEAAITETSQFGDVNIVDPAAVPIRPVSPRVGINFAIGSLLGLLLGVGLVLVRDRMDDRIRSPEDLKKKGQPWLASISVIENGLRKSAATGGLPATKISPMETHLVSFHSPLSSVSEEYRQLRVSLLFREPGQQLRTLLVTSPAPQEGKSTTAANLAITFAHAENRVLLVDADMRKPAVHTLFGLRKEPGLANILAGGSTIGEAIQRTSVQGLHILCSGTIPTNPAEILGGMRASEFVEHIRSLYDIVIFDSPPLLAVTDAGILSRLTDGVLMVVRACRTRLGALEDAAESLLSAGKTPTGIVLNNFDPGTAYGGSYLSARRERYSDAYGYTAERSRKSKS
jgi:capsular exopolysaccharide synthesis family protein